MKSVIQYTAICYTKRYINDVILLDMVFDIAVDEIVFNGITFRRYPDAPGLSDQRYYTPNCKHVKDGVGKLHQAIWKHYNGNIPKGHHIHHKDGNYLNNSIDNLECVQLNDHLRSHALKQSEDPDALKRKQEHCDRIRPLTKKWHASEEGKKWHSENCKRLWELKTPVKKKCEQCGQEFDSYTNRDSDKFCSNNCKSAWRRASGVDNETRTCIICGKSYRANKYSKSATCSRGCTATYRVQNMRDK